MNSLPEGYKIESVDLGVFRGFCKKETKPGFITRIKKLCQIK